MADSISDDTIRHMTAEALQHYAGAEEILPETIVEAVLRQLPPDFDRNRVAELVAELVPRPR